MWIFWLFSLLSFSAWFLPIMDYLVSGWRFKKLVDLQSNGSDPLPRLSVVFTALDESKTIKSALDSLLALNYPNLEIIAVNDRSTDGTGEILDQLALTDSRLRVIHILDLPAGWLGKTHGLQRGGETATGDYILFTDADVHFAPDALTRAVRHASTEDLDLLCVLPDLEIRGFWERLAILFWGSFFFIHTRPWRFSDPSSRAYIGIGAFNLVRTAAYREMGGHIPLKMEVMDDLKLGKLMKLRGGRVDCMESGGDVRIRWYEGVGGMARGLTKNMYAGYGLNPLHALLSMPIVMLMGAWPLFGLCIGPAGSRWIAGATMVILMATVAKSPTKGRCQFLYPLAYSMGAIIFVSIVARSMAHAYRQNGIVWRGTHYSLSELRNGVV